MEEIDILAVGGKNAIFGECKWRSVPADIAVLKDLKRKTRFFRGFDNVYLYVFSRSGFTPNMIKAAEEDGSVRLITLADIYEHPPH